MFKLRLLFALLLLGFLKNPGLCQEPKKKIAICSTTQVADFARQVVGDRWEVKCVLEPGRDPHVYEPTPNDAELVATADVCLQNGWHLEGNEWMKTLATQAGKPVIDCVKGVKPLQIQDGEEIDEGHDPHAWFTPVNAAAYVRNITEAVSKIDPENAKEYQARAELYLTQLRSLDVWIRKHVNAIPANKRVLVTSHDAFQYFCDAYGFKAASPVSWSTAELGAGLTPAKRQATIDSIRKFKVRAIFVETSANPKLIEELAKESGVEVGGALYADSMGFPGTAGESYIGMMRENVLKIISAL